MARFLLYLFSFCSVQFYSAQNNRFVVFLDAETDKILENVAIDGNCKKAVVTHEKHISKISHFRKSYVFATNLEGYRSELLTQHNLPSKGDTAFVKLIPTEAWMDQRWTQTDSLTFKRDTLPDFSDMKSWIRDHFFISESSQDHCGESLCSYGRSFRLNILFDLTDGYFLPSGIDTKHAGVKCKYIEQDVKRLLRRMPMVKADQSESGSRMMLPITVTL